MSSKIPRGLANQIKKRQAKWVLRNSISEPTERELKVARMYWELRRPQHLDEEVRPFLGNRTQHTALRTARIGLCLSTGSVAEKLNMARTNYARLESKEKSSSITLKSLKKAAEAMACEFIYAIVPKQRKTFSDLLWERLLPEAISQMKKRKHMRMMRGFFIGSLVIQQLNSAEFRRAQGLTKRLQLSHNPQSETRSPKYS